MPEPLRIAVIANAAWNLHHFRGNLMRAIRASGHAVIAVAAPDTSAPLLEAEGFPYRSFPLSSAGINPLRELRTVLALRRILREERIDAALSFTPKGNIYTGLALAGMPGARIVNISGLGRAFIRPSPLTHIVKLFYYLTLRGATRVFFQNEDDHRAFLAMKLVGAEKAEILPGSGVDLEYFTPRAMPAGDETHFLLVGRMLWDKGVGEFVEAARQIRRQHSQARFLLLGGLSDNPSAIMPAHIKAWEREGVIAYGGKTDDVRPALAAADCVVLPSYREGTPRALLEAAATARALIATDVPGCRSVVEDGGTGYLCPRTH